MHVCGLSQTQNNIYLFLFDPVASTVTLPGKKWWKSVKILGNKNQVIDATVRKRKISEISSIKLKYILRKKL